MARLNMGAGKAIYMRVIRILFLFEGAVFIVYHAWMQAQINSTHGIDLSPVASNKYESESARPGPELPYKTSLGHIPHPRPSFRIEYSKV